MKITFTIDRHSMDGFTLWAYQEINGLTIYKGKSRYIDYTIKEAKAKARQEIKENGRLD